MLNAIRDRAGKITDPVARFFGSIGFTPNALTVTSLLLAVIASLLYYYSNSRDLRYLLFFAGLIVSISSFMDAIDGALARQAGATRKGDFLDHVLDRYVDIFLICGILFAGYASLKIGVIAITGVLVSSYIATQGQAIQMERYYGGFGRADRLILIIVATFANWLYQDEIYGFCILGWSLILLAILSHLTAIHRFFYVWRKLD